MSSAPARTAAPAKVVARGRASDEDDEEGDAEGRRSRLRPAERENKTMMIAWIVTGVLALGAGLVVTIVVRKNIAIREAAEAEFKEQTRVIDETRKLSALATREASEELIQFVDKEKPKWEASDNASEIVTLRAKALNLIEREKQRTLKLQSMEAFDKDLAQLEKLSPEKIAEMRRTLVDLETGAETMGADFQAKLGKAKGDLNLAFVNALHEDAKAFAAANPDQASVALGRYTKAEDEIRALFDDVVKTRNKPLREQYEPHFRAVIEESDALAVATFTPEVIAKAPWKLLLVGEQAGFWRPAKAPGFSHHIENGSLSIIGPDANAKLQGLISIGYKEQWRDLVLDMEFTLESGEFELYTRLGERADSTVPMVKFSTSGEGAIVAGKQYEITVKLIGSTLEVIYNPEDQTPQPLPVKWQQSRKGEIGFLLPSGAKLKVTRMRVKELRSSGK